MYYLALACDYDGTLAKDGLVSSKTIDALERVGASGRKLILVTGRLLEDLQQVFPRLDLFTYVVAENGALLYHPASSTEQVLGEAGQLAPLRPAEGVVVEQDLHRQGRVLARLRRRVAPSR